MKDDKTEGEEKKNQERKGKHKQNIDFINYFLIAFEKR